MGMKGLDSWGPFMPRNVEFRYLLKLTDTVTAKSSVAKVKSLVSPYFGTQDLAFAYAA